MTDRIADTKPSITELEVADATDAARNGWGAQCYAHIDRFEREFAAQLGVHHAIATSSCTGALHMGLAGLGNAAGDEVTLAPKLLITGETGSDPSFRVDFSRGTTDSRSTRGTNKPLLLLLIGGPD